MPRRILFQALEGEKHVVQIDIHWVGEVHDPVFHQLQYKVLYKDTILMHLDWFLAPIFLLFGVPEQRPVPAGALLYVEALVEMDFK